MFSLFKKQQPKPFPLNSFIIAIPSVFDNLQIGKVIQYSTFNNAPIIIDLLNNSQITPTYLAHPIPFSPTTLLALSKLDPHEKYSLFSNIPIPNTPVILNPNLLSYNQILELIQPAIDWYEALPIHKTFIQSTIIYQEEQRLKAQPNKPNRKFFPSDNPSPQLDNFNLDEHLYKLNKTKKEN
jgi:hypothetical protein